MKHQTTVILFLLVTILCVPFMAAAQVAQEVEDHVNSLEGNELAGLEFTFPVADVDLTVTIDGFSFCAPSDPTDPPVEPPSFPNNVYGCRNDAVVTGTPVNDPVGVELDLAIDPLFLDFTTSRDRSLLCGDLGSGTVSEGGYANLTASLTGTIEFVEQNGCVRWVPVNGSEGFTLDVTNLESEDTCVDLYASVVLGLVLEQLESVLADQFLELIDDFLWERNLLTCGVPTQTISWSAVKANFISAGHE